MILKIPQYQHVFLLLLGSFFTTFAKVTEANNNFRDQFLKSTINKEPCQTYDQSIYWREWETQLKNKNIQVENGKITKTKASLSNLKKAKNVILLIGDGMGISTVTAARTYGGQKYSKKLENTCAGDYKLTMDQIFDNTALSKTYCLNTHTPDSSSTATAMYTGHKTKNQQIGHPEQALYVNIRNNQEKIPNIAQIAKKNGKSVGFITNTHMFHATPASLYANQTDRWNKEKTMKSFAEATIGENKFIDLAIGGGKKYFESWPNLKHPKTEESIELSDLRNFYHLPELEELKMGSSNTNSSNFFKNLWKNNKPILKPIWKKHRPWWVDLYENNQNQEYSNEPVVSLESLAEFGIRALQAKTSEEENGFFLMLESGRIDQAHHENFAKRALEETLEFDKTIKRIEEVLKSLNEYEDTLIILTADHSHQFTMGMYHDRTVSILDGQDFESPIYDWVMKKGEVFFSHIPKLWHEDFNTDRHPNKSVIDILQPELQDMGPFLPENINQMSRAQINSYSDEQTKKVQKWMAKHFSETKNLHTKESQNNFHQRYFALNYINGPGGPRYYDKSVKEFNEDVMKGAYMRNSAQFPSALLVPSASHGGEDVFIMARGPWSGMFSGVREQTFIFYVMEAAMTLDVEELPEKVIIEKIDALGIHQDCDTNVQSNQSSGPDYIWIFPKYQIAVFLVGLVFVIMLLLIIKQALRLMRLEKKLSNSENSSENSNDMIAEMKGNSQV